MEVIADRFNISEKTLYNYLNFLRSKELIYNHSDNLVLKSIRPYLKRIKTVIYIDDTFTLFDISCSLYGKILEQKAKQIAFRESVRRVGNRDKCKREFSETGFRPSLSIRTIAKILNCSDFKAVKIIQNLNRLQVIRTEKQKPKFISQNFKALNFISDYPGYRFNLGNALFEKVANKIEFLQFPIFLKRISIQQYKKINIKDL